MCKALRAAHGRVAEALQPLRGLGRRGEAGRPAVFGRRREEREELRRQVALLAGEVRREVQGELEALRSGLALLEELLLLKRQQQLACSVGIESPHQLLVR